MSIDQEPVTLSGGLLAGAITTGNIRRMLLVLAVPVLAEQMLNAFVGMFDTFLAGRISAVATNAIGLATYVAWLASMLFAMVGTGTTALVARLMGAGDHREANHLANQSISLAAINGIATGVLLYALAPVFAGLQAMTGEAAAITVEYLRLSAVGSAMWSMTLIGGAALRGAGDMRTPMVIQAAINILNVIASPCLVYGVGPLPELGITGIVCGTVLAQTLGAVFMLTVLARGRAGLRLRYALLKPSPARAWRVLRIGVPAGADGSIMWTGHFILHRPAGARSRNRAVSHPGPVTAAPGHVHYLHPFDARSRRYAIPAGDHACRYHSYPPADRLRVRHRAVGRADGRLAGHVCRHDLASSLGLAAILRRQMGRNARVSGCVL